MVLFAKFTQRADDLHRNLIVVADHRIHRCLCLNRATDCLLRFHFPVLGVKPRHRIRIVQHPCLLYGSQKDGETLDSYLTDHVFKGNTGTKVAPDPKDVEGFEAFMKRYTKGLSIERAAIENM